MSYVIHKNNWSGSSGIDLDTQIFEFECADHVINYAKDVGLFSKELIQYRENYYKSIALKIYKGILHTNSFKLSIFFRAKNSIIAKSGKNYIILLIKTIFIKVSSSVHRNS